MPTAVKIEYKPLPIPDPEAFDKYLQTFPAHKYQTLASELELSDVWWGRWKKSPQAINVSVLMRLADTLGVSPMFLMRNYGVGLTGCSALECLTLQSLYPESK